MDSKNIKKSIEIKEMRNHIMQLICDNPNLVRLLTPDNEDIPEDPTETLPYKYLMPYELITGTLTETTRFLGFDIFSTIDSRNNTFKNLQIEFYVVCHQSLIPYEESLLDESRKGYSSCWYDLVTCELDTMFSETNKLGVGKMELVKNEPYFVSYAREIPYKGRTLTFNVLDYNDATKHGNGRWM